MLTMLLRRRIKRKTWKKILGKKNFHGKKAKRGVPFACKGFSTMRSRNFFFTILNESN